MVVFGGVLSRKSWVSRRHATARHCVVKRRPSPLRQGAVLSGSFPQKERGVFL